MKLQEFKVDLHKRGFNVFESWNVLERCPEVVLFKFDTDELRFERVYQFTTDGYINSNIYQGALKEGVLMIEELIAKRHFQNPETCTHSVKRLNETTNVCEYCMGKMGTIVYVTFNDN